MSYYILITTVSINIYIMCKCSHKWRIYVICTYERQFTFRIEYLY